MRQREHHDLSGEAGRELDALDRALAGEPVAAEFDAVARLARDMETKRPEIAPEFAARLDAQVRRGFRAGPGTQRPASARFRDWLAGLRPMRIVAPAGALATVVVIASVAVMQNGGGEDGAPVTTETTNRDGSAPAPAPLLEGESGGAGATAPEADALSAGGPGANGDRAAPNESRKVESSASLTLSTDGE